MRGVLPSLKLMTYNIQGHAAKGRPDHLPKIAEVISAVSPDAVGLQEVHCRTRASVIDQASHLAELTGLKLVFGRSCAIDGGDYGNAVLTKHEITASHVHPLPGSGEPRSLLQADIKVSGTQFTFFVTHLAAWGRLLRVARIRQINELADIIARGAFPHVLCGDFNVPPGAEEMNILLSRGHLRMCGAQNETTFPMTRQRLDYIMCDPRWEYVSSEVIRRGPSDHWPFVVELKLRGE
jgi:endonuclease/exonuclease/phosphatase family metal-dependent hydrolase